MREVTSKEILQAAEIGDVVTLTRWHKQKLIPPPEVKTHPEGRGKMAFWPEWVLERCVRIKQLRKDGKSLNEIREFLGSDWGEEQRRYERRYRFAEATQVLDRQAALMNLRAAVEEHLLGWMDHQKKRINKRSVSFIAADAIEKAILMLKDGINPVLVIDGQATYLTADFVVAEHLSQCRSMKSALIVIPIFQEVTTYLRDQVELPDAPSKRPSSTVIDISRSTDNELRFMMASDWSFELERPSARRRKNTRRAH